MIEKKLIYLLTKWWYLIIHINKGSELHLDIETAFLIGVIKRFETIKKFAIKISLQRRKYLEMSQLSSNLFTNTDIVIL